MMVQAPDLSITEIQARALAAKWGDLSEYSKAVHDWETEPYQDAWGEALETEDRILIICPPDTYKSSTVQCFIEKAIGTDPNVRILWLMKAGSQAQARVMAVAETIEESNVYREAFHVEPNKQAQWSKTALYVKRSRHGPDPTLMGCGFNGPYQGFHFDIIIVDDPTNQQDVMSPTLMEGQRLKLRGVIRDRLTEGGRFVGIMTRWGEDDLLPVFDDMGFRIVTMPIIADYPWGPTISNTRFPLDYCYKLRHEKTDAIFDLTYMCDPSAMDGGIIRRSYIRYWDNLDGSVSQLPQSGTVTLMACDPAASTKNRADPSCIGTGVLELKSKILYITDMWARKVEILELEAELKKRAKQTAKLVSIGLETKGFQLTFFQRLRREAHLPIKELPYRTKKQAQAKASGIDNDKTSRAVSVAQMFMEGRLLISRDLELVEGVSLESELCSFPYGKHDDRLDVVAFLCGMADSYSGPKIRVSLR